MEYALHNYDAGLKALSRRIVKNMVNSRLSIIYKHLDFRHNLWIEYATFGALYRGSMDDMDNIAFPNSEFAIEEEQTEKHAGLFWADHQKDDGKNLRFFLPNYFNTFCQSLRIDATYSNLVGNKGTVLEMIVQYDEAQKHFEEAEDFIQR